VKTNNVRFEFITYKKVGHNMQKPNSSDVVQVAPWRDRTARGLMGLAAVGAAVAFASAWFNVSTASSGDLVVQVWRWYGFGVFAGLFLLLAIAPRRYAGVWELVIANKLALSITGFILLPRNVPEASSIFGIDGSLAVITIVAYLLAQGYSGWRRV
jgi:hypothetical protein